MNDCSCRSDSFTNNISSSASVCSGIFGIRVHNIKSDETEAIRLNESRARFHRLIIVEPFDLHRRIRHWNQSAFEMSPLTFFDLDIVQRSCKNGCLSGCFFDNFFPLIFRSVFEIMNLFESKLVLRVRQDLCT